MKAIKREAKCSWSGSEDGFLPTQSILGFVSLSTEWLCRVNQMDLEHKVSAAGISGGVLLWISSTLQFLGLNVGVWSVFGMLWHVSLSGFI